MSYMPLEDDHELGTMGEGLIYPDEKGPKSGKNPLVPSLARRTAAIIGIGAVLLVTISATTAYYAGKCAGEHEADSPAASTSSRLLLSWQKQW